FENSVVAMPGGNGMQAVALRVNSNRAMFYKVKIKGTQDTLLDNTGTVMFGNDSSMANAEVTEWDPISCSLPLDDKVKEILSHYPSNYKQSALIPLLYLAQQQHRV
ncbi:hypothetical protein S245_065904, partial [Arachis hypogaea]